jgi:adenylate cyclase
MNFRVVTFTMNSALTTTVPTHFPRFTKVIAVLDVVESVRLMEQDEHAFISRWHRFVEFASQLVPGHGGRVHKSLGDGLMLEFAEPQGCVRAAFALQDWCRQANSTMPPDNQMHLRLGAHLAEFVADKYDIYGNDVNLTARIAGLAGPGEIVVSAELRDRLAPGLDADIEDLGECFLKHVKQPVRVYRIGPVGEAPVIERGAGLAADLRPTIAVIPFSTRSAEPLHQMLGEALADEVIAALSRTSELHVISRLSTTVFRAQHHAVDKIRDHLGARYILSGMCRTIGSTLALFVELIDAHNSHVVWADNLKGGVQDVFAAGDDLIARLVAGVSSSVVAHEMQRARSHALPTLEGYTLLLGAVGLMHRTQFSEFDRARAMFETLIDRSRRHPIPYAWLAKWHVLRAAQGWTEDNEKEARLALDCIKRALDCDSECALAWTVDGFVHANLIRDLDTAAQRYETALSLNPNESMAWLLKGTLHAFKGEGESAMAGTERALRLSPLDPLRYFYDSLAGTAAASAGAYDRAIELCKRSLRSNRTHTSTYRALAIAQSRSGRIEEARETVRELLKLDPGFNLRDFAARSPTSKFPHGRDVLEALRRAGVPE